VIYAYIRINLPLNLFRICWTSKSGMFNHLREGVKANDRDKRAASCCSKGPSRRRITAFEIIHIGHRVCLPPPVSVLRYTYMCCIHQLSRTYKKYASKTGIIIIANKTWSAVDKLFITTFMLHARVRPHTHTHTHKYTKPVYWELGFQTLSLFRIL
jgi:hypothetical protein